MGRAAAIFAFVTPHRRPTPDLLAQTAVFLAAFLVFWASPVQHRSDSRYTLVVAETLLRTGRISLDPRVVAEPGEGAGYHLERAGANVYFRPPIGGAVFSVPFVLALKPFGLSALDAEGRYDAAGEYRAQRIIASFLMAALAVFVFRTARLLLPLGPSLLVAALAAFGTQVWSTASRALWSDTWSLALMGYVVWRLGALELAGKPLHPALLATLLGAVFFARPTGAAHVLVVSAHVARWQRKMLPAMVGVGLAWLAAFVASSWLMYGRALPAYYSLSALGTSAGWQPLLANLFSPSRGLLICVPLVPAVVYLVVKHRARLDVPARRLAATALAGIAGQLAIVAFWYVWWAGHSYGARHTTGTVPWVALLTVLAIDAARRAWSGRVHEGGSPRRELAVAGALALASVLLQARGALSEATQRWNLRPSDVDEHPERVWDWRYPQWLAGLVSPPHPPASALALGQPLAVGAAAADAYLREGWSWPEPDVRWVDEPTARVEFALDAEGPLILRAKLRPAPGRHPPRAVRVELNGGPIGTWTLDRDGPSQFAAFIERAARGTNVLTLRTEAEWGLEAPGDERPLRLGVYWLRVDRHPTLAPGQLVALGRPEADRHVGPGWGEAEGDYRWTVAPRAELFLAGEALPPGILRLQAHAYPVSTRGSGQRVFVALDDDLAWTFALREADTVVRAVPLTGGIPRLGRLRLDLPDLKPDPPAGDTRRLGAAVHWIRYDPFPMLSLAQPVRLGEPEAAAFLGDGWAEPEGGLRWTAGTSADLYFAAEPGRGARLALVLEAFRHRRLPAQRVRFELNGERLAEITVSDPGRRPVELTPPPGALRSENVLRLLLPDARSPASLGISRDTRVLGIRADTLELR